MSATPDWLEKALEPHPEDSSDLRWALETAVALFVRGDRPQAMRWLEHAVLTANAEGRAERASVLERAASELEHRPFPGARSSPAMPAVTPPPKGTQLIPAMPPIESTVRDNPPAAAAVAPGKVPTAPYKIAPDDVTHLGQPDSQLLAACEASEPTPNLAAGEAPFTPPPPARPRPPTLIRDGLDATITNVRERPAPPSVREGERTVVMGPDEIPQPSAGPVSMMTRAPSTLGSSASVLEPMRAVRVVIESGTGRDIVVRLLDDGEDVPLGAQEALLIPLGIGKKPPLDPTRS